MEYMDLLWQLSQLKILHLLVMGWTIVTPLNVVLARDAAGVGGIFLALGHLVL